MSARKWHCTMCSERFSTSDLIEFKEMGEDFLHLGDTGESNEIICPDCMDRWNEMDENEKFDYLCKRDQRGGNP